MLKALKKETTMLPPQLAMHSAEYRLPFPERFEKIRRFGFVSIEASTLPQATDREFREYKAVIADSGLDVIAAHDWFHLLAPTAPDDVRSALDRFSQNLDRAAQLGADRLVWYTGEHPDLGGIDALGTLAERLSPMLDKAESLGILLVLETEFSANGTDPAANTATLLQLLSMVSRDSLAVNFDAANVYLAGEEPFPYAYSRLRPWIRHVHLKDIRFAASDSEDDESAHRFKGHKRQGICCPLGEGGVNTTGLLGALRDDGYDGYLTFELHVPEPLHDVTLEKGIRLVRQVYA